MLHQRLARSEGGAAERERLLDRVGLAGEGGRAGGDDEQGHAAAARHRPALIGAPRLVLLDEPTSALDPGGRRTVRDLLSACASKASGCC